MTRTISPTPVTALLWFMCTASFALTAHANESGLSATPQTTPQTSVIGTAQTNAAQLAIKADVWADNWYALYLDDELIKEDSVPFKTERSFNTDTFTFTAQLPATFSVIIKDYFENDSGLEYIGSRRQQIGDGGFQAQFFDANTKQLIAVSDDNWRCNVIHRAPINPSCVSDKNPNVTCKSEIKVEPSGWKSEKFDDKIWPKARIYSAQDVRPHGGYRDASWEPTAHLIWSNDLEIDNVLLCRFTITEQ